MSITISGSGSFVGDSIEFDYTIETDDGSVLEHSCVATKQTN